ncbi:Cyclase-associated protein 1-like [Heracleum sosnowskyi]|uniref:Cyclase-associated protein 1-like n=1 Tax=Heracleum sosnowskyi TaxID=360622 RepID=A0AAD8NAD9_9APIA|nr:Cyclase-associated protein 1-like [Heracleum sosnowskyi]
MEESLIRGWSHFLAGSQQVLRRRSEEMRRVVRAAERIGGEVFNVTKVLEEGFSVEKDLIIQTKQSQKPDTAGLGTFLKPLNQVITKANEMTGGNQSNFFSHLKTVAASMSALAWIAFTGKDCGMSMPIAHVEECWQSAEFYNNKVLVEYRNNDPNHAEWAKALKELYTPGLRDYVKAHYPLGPVWSATGKSVVSAPSSSSAAPSASLFS